jgi:hypothetical protein
MTRLNDFVVQLRTAYRVLGERGYGSVEGEC